MTIEPPSTTDSRNRRRSLTAYERDASHRMAAVLIVAIASEIGTGDHDPDPELRKEWGRCLRERRDAIASIPELAYGVSPRRNVHSLLGIMPAIIETIESGRRLGRSEKRMLEDALRFTKNTLGEYDRARAQGIDVAHAQKRLDQAKAALEDAEAEMALTIERAAWTLDGGNRT